MLRWSVCWAGWGTAWSGGRGTCCTTGTPCLASGTPYAIPSWYWYTILSWYWYTRLRRHPASGEMVWCNQASVSHGSYYTSLPDAEALGYTDQVMRVMIRVMMMMMVLAGDCSLPHWPH